MPMVSKLEDMENGMAGEGGAAPDRIYPGDKLSSLQERARPGPHAQLRSLYDIGLPPQRHPEEKHQVTWEEHANISPAPNHPGE